MLAPTRQRESFRREVEAIPSLPSLPAVVGKILQVVNSPTSSARDLSAIIRNDPALAAKILRVANSAFYGMTRQIDSLDFGIVILGLHKVRDLALGISVMRAFRSVRENPAFNRARFWEHCATCALVCQYLSGLLGLKLGHEAFVAGLLHDIGKIVLDNYFHDRFLEAFDLIESRQIPNYEAEAEVFGADHSEVGSWLAEKWNFPGHLTCAIGRHHNPLASPEDHRIIASICHVADEITKGKAQDISGSPSAFVLDDDPGWQLLRQSSRNARPIDAERMFFELDDELRQVRELLRIMEEPGSIV